MASIFASSCDRLIQKAVEISCLDLPCTSLCQDSSFVDRSLLSCFLSHATFSSRSLILCLLSCSVASSDGVSGCSFHSLTPDRTPRKVSFEVLSVETACASNCCCVRFGIMASSTTIALCRPKSGCACDAALSPISISITSHRDITSKLLKLPSQNCQTSNDRRAMSGGLRVGSGMLAWNGAGFQRSSRTGSPFDGRIDTARKRRAWASNVQHLAFATRASGSRRATNKEVFTNSEWNTVTRQHSSSCSPRLRTPPELLPVTHTSPAASSRRIKLSNKSVVAQDTKSSADDVLDALSDLDVSELGDVLKQLLQQLSTHLSHEPDDACACADDERAGSPDFPSEGVYVRPAKADLPHTATPLMTQTSTSTSTISAAPQRLDLSQLERQPQTCDAESNDPVKPDISLDNYIELLRARGIVPRMMEQAEAEVFFMNRLPSVTPRSLAILSMDEYKRAVRDLLLVIAAERSKKVAHQGHGFGAESQQAKAANATARNRGFDDKHLVDTGIEVQAQQHQPRTPQGELHAGTPRSTSASASKLASPPTPRPWTSRNMSHYTPRSQDVLPLERIDELMETVVDASRSSQHRTATLRRISRCMSVSNPNVAGSLAAESLSQSLSHGLKRASGGSSLYGRVCRHALAVSISGTVSCARTHACVQVSGSQCAMSTWSMWFTRNTPRPGGAWLATVCWA